MSGIGNHVTSLELSKRLWELGVKQESYFWWVNDRLFGSNSEYFNFNDLQIVGDISCGDCHEHTLCVNEDNVYRAYLASELGEMLRPYLNKDIWLHEVHIKMESATYMIDEANSRAEMLLYLIKHGIVKAEDL